MVPTYKTILKQSNMYYCETLSDHPEPPHTKTESNITCTLLKTNFRYNSVWVI